MQNEYRAVGGPEIAGHITSRPVRVLVVGPGRGVRGGITTVLSAYERNDIWEKYHCDWLETYDDRGHARKILAFLKSLPLALRLIPGRDIVHVHAAHRTSFCRKAFFVLLAKCFGKKTILHLHAPYPHAFDNGFMNRLARYVFSHADVVVALSAFWADQVHRIAPCANVVVIPNPCAEPAEEVPPQRLRKRSVLFVGKLEPRKGYADLLRAMSAIIARVPEAELVLAGDGEVEAAGQLAEELRIRDRIRFLGWVSAEEVHHALSQASVFCLPSYAEGVPMAMLDAMSYRVPVVVTPVGGIPDIIRQGENGFIVNPGDVASIASTIQMLLACSSLRQEVADRAYNDVMAEFSPTTVCQRMATIYDALLDAKPTD